jgi:hypothetical protein
VKIDNIELAFALNDQAGAISAERVVPIDVIRAVAQYVADHPTSAMTNERALELLGLNELPAETWGYPLPDIAVGEVSVRTAVEKLNQDYPRSTLHALVALRSLAWHCTQLARALQTREKHKRELTISAHGGNTAGIFLRQPLVDEASTEQFKALMGHRVRKQKVAANGS